MARFISREISGRSSENEHHSIASELKAMSDRWDEIELSTGNRPPEAFDYSFGLIMGEELIFASLPRDANTLRQKILVGRG